MKNAYIVRLAENETPEEVGFRLRDALKAVAGEREYPIVDSVFNGRGGIAAFSCNLPGKAVVVGEDEAEELARSLGQTMGDKYWRADGLSYYRIAGTTERDSPTIHCLTRRP